MGKIVRVSREELPPLTGEDKLRLQALAQRPDEEIDCSDIPPLDETFWKNARPARQAMEERAKARDGKKQALKKTA